MKYIIALTVVVGLTLGGFFAHEQGIFDEFFGSSGPSMEDRIAELESQNQQLARAVKQINQNIDNLFRSAQRAFAQAQQIDLIIARGLVSGDCVDRKLICDLKVETRKCYKGSCAFPAVVINCDKEFKQCMKQVEEIGKRKIR
jgi:hypothetical protein